jgi:hypothetical protein
MNNVVRNVGFVPVELGESVVVDVPVVAQEGAKAHIEQVESGIRIVLDESLDASRANKAVAALMPTIIAALSRKLLN